jgi:hypothetical protein
MIIKVARTSAAIAIIIPAPLALASLLDRRRLGTLRLVLVPRGRVGR